MFNNQTSSGNMYLQPKISFFPSTGKIIRETPQTAPPPNFYSQSTSILRSILTPLNNNFHVITQIKFLAVVIAPVPFLFLLHAICMHRFLMLILVLINNKYQWSKSLLRFPPPDKKIPQTSKITIPPPLNNVIWKTLLITCTACNQ